MIAPCDRRPRAPGVRSVLLEAVSDRRNSNIAFTKRNSVEVGRNPARAGASSSIELVPTFRTKHVDRYSVKCQFAHGREELRPVLRHPKYKTEICRTFATHNACPYGSRCRFIHYQPEKAPNIGVAQSSAIAALVSGAASTTDWSDAFLGTPAPLDPRPARAAAAQEQQEHYRHISQYTVSVDSPVSSAASAQSPIDTSPSAAVTTPTATTNDFSDSDSDDFRRLPVFSNIANSPKFDIFDRSSAE